MARQSLKEYLKNKDYLAGKQIGQGSFGPVYEGLHTITAEPVTIKVLSYDGDQERRQSASRELNILQQLKHQNISSIRDVQIIPTGHEIVTDLCSNGSLLKFLQNNPNGIEQHHRINMFKQLMSGLSYVHGMGITHRNIKPANILMHRSLLSGQIILKIADVGLAKLLFKDSMQLNQRTAIYMQTFCRTQPYMAPEVFQGHYTTKSDIFSMGLVMYVMCELPPGLIPPVVVQTHQNIGQYYQAILMSPMDLLGARNCGSYEREIINKMLQPDHHNRPQASDVLEEVQDQWQRLQAQQ